ncbi:MAG: L,D-transpeptidase family protein [bacterium]
MNKQKNIKKKLFLIIFILIIFFLTGSSIAFMVNKPLRYTFKKTIFVPLKNFTLSIFKQKYANSLLVNVNNNVKYKPADVKTIKQVINHIKSVKKNKRKLKIILPSDFTYPYLYHGIYRKGNNLFSVIMSKLGYLPIECIPFDAAAGNKNYIYIKYEHNKYCRWRWKWKNLPENFIKDWKPDYFSSMLEGAAMNFQYQNGLKITGRINENVWKTAFKDLKINKKNKYGITYIWADKSFPKTLHLWKNGKNILVSFVNTGVFDAPTYNGISPVYTRYFEASMAGKTPWDKPYDDKNIPFINYFNYSGEAIHGFPRGIYGINRSLGCLELPLRNAWIVWKKINFGTMVGVIKNTNKEPAFKQKNYLHPKIKNFIPDANFLNII